MKTTNTKNYWTQEQEDAIMKYNASTDTTEKNRIYEDYIYHPIYRVAEAQFNRYSYDYIKMYNENEDTIMDMVIKVTTALDKIDTTKGKAFSYISRMCHNEYILLNKKAYNKFKSEKSLDIKFQNEDGDMESYLPKELIVDPTQDLLEYKKLTEYFIQYLEDNFDRICSDFVTFRTNKRKYENNKEILKTLIGILKNVQHIEPTELPQYTRLTHWYWRLLKDATGLTTINIDPMTDKLKGIFQVVKREYMAKQNNIEKSNPIIPASCFTKTYVTKQRRSKLRKLTPELVADIRKSMDKPKVLAEKYGVSITSIYLILNNRTYLD